MTDQHRDSAFERFKEETNHRPRMTYDTLSLVFTKSGNLLLEQNDAVRGSSKVVVPDYQLDLVVAFIKQHRLDARSLMLAAFDGDQATDQAA